MEGPQSKGSKNVDFSILGVIVQQPKVCLGDCRITPKTKTNVQTVYCPAKMNFFPRYLAHCVLSWMMFLWILVWKIFFHYVALLYLSIFNIINFSLKMCFENSF